MNVSHDAVIEEQTEEHYILDTFLNKALAARAHVSRLHAEHVYDLRNIVRGKAPHCILIATDAAQIHALCVNVINRTEFARGDHSFQTMYDRVVLKKMTNHKNPVELL